MAALDPDLVALLPELDALLAGESAAASAEDARAIGRKLVAALHSQVEEPFAGSISDDQIAGSGAPVPVRMYEPDTPSSDVVLYFHGGGWVVGDLDAADATARAIASSMESTVVSVDYRLAPEHPFPAALDDCLAVATAISRARKPTWLGVAGDSAGGNLAAAVSLTAPLAGIRIDGQLLIFPALDSSMSTQSYKDLAEGYLLTAELMQYYWKCYGAANELGDPRLSPADASELSGMPPTVITSAGFDPLRDEVEAFASRLVAAGVPTIFLPAPSLAHGWLDMTDRVPAAKRTRAQVLDAFDFLRRHKE